MKPIYFNGKWSVEVCTEEFGNVLLLNKSGLLTPLEFNSEKEALEYIESINK